MMVITQALHRGVTDNRRRSRRQRRQAETCDKAYINNIFFQKYFTSVQYMSLGQDEASGGEDDTLAVRIAGHDTRNPAGPGA